MQSIGEVLEDLMLLVHMENGGRGGGATNTPPPATGQTELPARIPAETRAGLTRKTRASSHEISPANGRARISARSVTENCQKGPGTEAPGQFREERQTVAEKEVCKIQQLPNDRPMPAALTVVARNKCVANPTRLPREAAHLFLITVDGMRTDH